MWGLKTLEKSKANMSSWYTNPGRWTAFIQGIAAQQAPRRLPWPARTCERIFIESFSAAHTTAASVHAWRISAVRGVNQKRMEEELLWRSWKRKLTAAAPAPWFTPDCLWLSETGSCCSHLLAVRWARYRCRSDCCALHGYIVSTFKGACKTTESAAHLLWHI